MEESYSANKLPFRIKHIRIFPVLRTAVDESNRNTDDRTLRDGDAIDNYRLLAVAIDSADGKTITVNDLILFKGTSRIAGHFQAVKW